MVVDVTNIINEGYVSLEGKNELKISDVSAVCVHSIEGDNIPHFHLERSAKKKRLKDICVRLDTNEFFNHGGKDDILNAKDSRILYEWLCKPNTKYPISGMPGMYFNNWQVLADMWNGRKTTIVDLNNMPNYSVIYPYK